jgi:hypothetical protein
MIYYICYESCGNNITLNFLNQLQVENCGRELDQESTMHNKLRACNPMFLDKVVAQPQNYSLC